MNIFLKKLLFLNILISGSFMYVYAARIIVDAPAQAAQNGQPIVVGLFLDAEKEAISGIAGNFSFPSELFEVEDISVQNSIVSLWVNQPAISQEKYLDGRTHITFEGIFPGGYSGVRNPFRQGTQTGMILYLKLIPKQKGNGILALDDVTLNAFDSNATKLPVDSVYKRITIPELQDELPGKRPVLKEVDNKVIDITVSRDDSVNANAWYLIVSDVQQTSSIASIYVAETDNRNPLTVGSIHWRAAKNPYILFYQDRNKYIHVKIVYTNNTYTIKTLQPVENSSRISKQSRILIGIAVMLLVMYFYGSKHFTLFRKKI
jgi:hypothetical protein